MGKLYIAGREFRSRLIVGTGKYRSFQEMARCHAASGAEVVTVAVRRVNLTDRSKESMLDYIDREQHVHPAQHRRLLHRRRRHPHRAPGARGGPLELGEARSDRRREDAVPG